MYGLPGRLTVNSCMVLAVEADGRSVETIEASGERQALAHPGGLRKASGRQCGFCTSGMILSVRELLQRNPKPSVDQIKKHRGEFLSLHGYQQIIEAVLDVSANSRKRGTETCLRIKIQPP